jgi:hypothetical protein
VNRVISEMSVARLPTVQPSFAVTPEWREEFYTRLKGLGVEIDRAQFQAGGTVVDRILAERVSSMAFGDSASFRRSVPRDTQLQTALGILRGARTQADAFARVPAQAPAPAAAPTRG